MSEPSNKECDNLDKRVREGDVDSSLLDEVARCLSEEVLRFTLARCGDRTGDAEDITQDAMLAAQRYLGSFRGDASLRTWLYKLVLSACSHRRRGRKNDPALHRSLDADTGMELSEADPANPEVVLLISERLGALEEALQTLNPADRQLLAAAEWEDLSLEQVGERHGLSVSAVKSRLFRIRRRLRDQIQERFAATGQDEG